MRYFSIYTLQYHINFNLYVLCSTLHVLPSNTLKAGSFYVPPSTVYTPVLCRLHQFSVLVPCANKATVRDQCNYRHFSVLCLKSRGLIIQRRAQSAESSWQSQRVEGRSQGVECVEYMQLVELRGWIVERKAYSLDQSEQQRKNSIGNCKLKRLVKYCKPQQHSTIPTYCNICYNNCRPLRLQIKSQSVEGRG